MTFKQGDILWMDFSPAVGHEPKHRRSALVVSGEIYNLVSNLTLVCPITTNDNGFPFHQKISSVKNVSGFIAIEQVRAVDMSVRAGAEKIGKLPPEELLAVLTCLHSFLDA